MLGVRQHRATFWIHLRRYLYIYILLPPSKNQTCNIKWILRRFLKPFRKSYPHLFSRYVYLKCSPSTNAWDDDSFRHLFQGPEQLSKIHLLIVACAYICTIIYLYMYIYIYQYTYIYIYIHSHINIYNHIYIYTNVYMYICTYMMIRIINYYHIYNYMCVWSHIYIQSYIYNRIYIYIFIHTTVYTIIFKIIIYIYIIMEMYNRI